VTPGISQFHVLLNFFDCFCLFKRGRARLFRQELPLAGVSFTANHSVNWSISEGMQTIGSVH
jgi:hypothetical protein